MRAGELEQPLQEGALREIERSLYGKLKAHRVSDSFIDRFGEDAVQKGLLEYLRAREAGTQIDNRDAFVVRAAFCRAIDELRREAYRSDGGTVEGLLDVGHEAEPPSEELALEHLEAQELREAIEGLPTEDRQVLALHYFLGVSAARGSQILYCSEATFRRRLKRALRSLGGCLGVSAPEPGSELALEIGLAAWAGLGGAKVALAQGPLDQLASLLERGRDGLHWLSDRLRDPVARAEASGTTERAGAIASGPAGKVLGGCAAAAIICAVGGVVAPDIARHTTAPPPQGKRPAVARAAQSAPKPSSASTPVALGLANTGQSVPSRETAARVRREASPAPSEKQRVKQQFSGVARAGAETSAPAEAGASAAESETVTVTPSESSSSSSESAQQQFGFEGKP